MKGPELYFLMIKFAGTVPVAFLSGVTPPVGDVDHARGDGKLTALWKTVLGAGAAEAPSRWRWVRAPCDERAV